MKKMMKRALAGTIIATGVITTLPVETPTVEAAQISSIKMFKEAPFEAYRVTEGDSFWFIAARYGLDYKELMRLNPNVNPLYMKPGSVIRLKPEGKSNYTENSALGQFETEVASLVNKERAKAGLQPLTLVKDLSGVAEEKANDMSTKGYFSHTSPSYGSPFDMMKRFGIQYTAAGENIAQGQRSPEEVMNSWMNSSGHRANILNSQFNQIGIGYKNGYWVQMFVKR
jgi:uncharacterized YkwD family protein